MGDQATERQVMRQVLRARRAGLDESDQGAASVAVLARLARIPVLRSADVVAGYRAVRGEVDIDASLILLEEAGVLVTVPRVVGEHLEFLPWCPEKETVRGSFGIWEPLDGVPVPMLRHDVVLAPLVAFDEHGHRLGQGGGYYDRTLGPITPEFRPIMIGIAHSFQQLEHVPSEAWDVPLDAIVTEDEVREFRPGVLDPPIH
jgi:5-formyltetrahydrofolate cyclo-ligase